MARSGLFSERLCPIELVSHLEIRHLNSCASSFCFIVISI